MRQSSITSFVGVGCLVVLVIHTTHGFSATTRIRRKSWAATGPLRALAIDEKAADVAASDSLETPSTAQSFEEQSSVTTLTSFDEKASSSKSVSTETTSNSKSWTDDGFVFGLQDSGLSRPKGRAPKLVVENDSLITQPYQVRMVQATFAAHAFFAVSSFSHMLSLHHGDLLSTCIEAVSLLIASWILADFGSGVLHWSVDNYGNGKTPIMGSIIAAFQGHHAAPWTIAERGFCNNVYKLCVPFGPVPMGLIYALFIHSAHPSIVLFMTIFCALEILSQEFHKWSHQLKSQVPAWVNTLQNIGLTIPRVPHAQHHLAPYEGNYCIISGVCNEALDQTGFFRRLEHVIYRLNGVESNAWKLDAALRERTLRGDYTLVKQS
jgi:hypothetical protein